MRQAFVKNVLSHEEEIIAAINQHAYHLDNMHDLQPLFDRIGDARVVMLGEASHGTHEYYTWRAYISKRLIEEKGFSFIAVEGDWPDCYQLNRFIKGYDPVTRNPTDVLHQFNRWPTWMWANWEMVEFANWLQGHNHGKSANKKVGFYGLDVYSLWESMESIMNYLQKTDKAALKVAEEAYRCFEPYRKEEGQSYARASMFVPELCQTEVIDLLSEIRKKMPSYNTDHENVFSAEQNAIIIVNAERYYRAMIQGGPHSWNVRDDHMADTLDRLLNFHGPGAKAIVWAHNTHIGDARATDMNAGGMFNIGELARMQHHHRDVVLVGFGSFKGTVIAGKSWGAAMQSMKLPEASKASWEFLLHKVNNRNKLLIMDDLVQHPLMMEMHIGHRAVGVVYDPRHEKPGNYVPSILPMRYDAFIYLDQTRALLPLHIKPDGHLVPETYPFGE
jgi:erythromycin esterase